MTDFYINTPATGTTSGEILIQKKILFPLVSRKGNGTSSHNGKSSTFLARQALCRLFLLQDILCGSSQHLLLRQF